MTYTDPAHQARRWNERYQPGQPVLYYPSGAPDPKPRETKTTTSAYVLSGHTAVCFVAGVRGCVALDALEPFDPADFIVPSGRPRSTDEQDR